jgi:hypothetical protein
VKKQYLKKKKKPESEKQRNKKENYPILECWLIQLSEGETY